MPENENSSSIETARERVLRTIGHIQPEVVPVNVIGFDPLDRWLERFRAVDNFDLRERLGLDIQFGRAVFVGPGSESGRDIWGKPTNVMGADGLGYGSARGCFPLAAATTVAEIERFAWPNPDNFDYDIAAEILRSVPRDTARLARMLYALPRAGAPRMTAARGSGIWMPLLCSLFDLLGMEKTLVGLHTEPKLIEAIIAHLEAFILGFEQRLLDATRGLVDVFEYSDDFASQAGMLISPAHWRRFLKPTYEKIYGLAKSYGLKVWIHSCGTFRPVLPDMLAMGMDVWETVQVHLPGNDPETLKREYGRDLTFFGAINSQQTLPFGTPGQVRAEVRERIRVLGRGGGYICGPDHTVMADVPIENVIALLDEVRRFRL